MRPMRLSIRECSRRLMQGFNAIVCIGEVLEEREAGKAKRACNGTDKGCAR